MALVEAGDTIELDPRAGFVVKTRILQARSAVAPGTKVFINVCHDAQVPRPAVEFDASVVFALIIENQWEIPLVVSNEKTSTDKKGAPSYVYDCCINPACFQWIQLNGDLRSILIEWCIEAVEMLYTLTLEREYTVPKMLCKGDLSHTVVPRHGGMMQKLEELKQNETLGLIQELHDTEEPEDDGAELPQLMNIHEKPTNKPLIEELGDMKITDRPTVVAKTAPKTRLQFSLNFVKLKDHDHRLLVKLECAQLETASHLTVNYRSDTDSLVVTNSDSRFYFSKQAETTLDIPLPLPAATLVSYFVKGEHTLYIFC